MEFPTFYQLDQSIAVLRAVSKIAVYTMYKNMKKIFTLLVLKKNSTSF